MKKSIVLIILCSFIVISVFSEVKMETGEGLFPLIEGFEKKGKVENYSPDTLFEYINGAADLFLSYDFRKLYTLGYEKNEEGSVTVDIYRHRDNANCFGIYSQEKPDDGKFLKLGTQGYYEEGVLNFFKGLFYVKISSFDLGKDDYSILFAVAQSIAKNIKFRGEFPGVLEFFPEKGKVVNSEKYTNLNFMGHSFLHSAFTVGYKFKEKNARIFIINAGNKSGAESIIEKYAGFIQNKGEKVIKAENGYNFTDPYYRSSGKMYIRVHGKYLYGFFCSDKVMAGLYLGLIKKRMMKN